MTQDRQPRFEEISRIVDRGRMKDIDSRRKKLFKQSISFGRLCVGSPFGYIGDVGTLSASFSTQITLSSLDSRGNGGLHWLFGASKSATRRNARSPPQPYLISLAGNPTATARFACWSSPVAFPPVSLAGPTSIVGPMAWGRHAEQGSWNDQEQFDQELLT